MLVKVNGAAQVHTYTNQYSWQMVQVRVCACTCMCVYTSMGMPIIGNYIPQGSMRGKSIELDLFFRTNVVER